MSALDLLRGAGPSLLGERPGRAGYRRLALGPQDERVLRRDLGGVEPSTRLQRLLTFVHMSDLHITDSQSPARAEFFDRLSDPDSPWLDRLGHVQTYRPQESLSCHVLESMAAAVRGGAGPGADVVDFAIVTGDATDNAQRNELDNCLALLSGGLVRPDSGDLSTWEGVGGSWGPYDPYYWHPDGTPPGEQPDRPASLYGFPGVSGLLDACRRPWRAEGIGVPWYAVYGNHDTLLCGTLAPTPLLQHLVQGAQKPIGWGEGADLALLAGHDNQPPDVLRAIGSGQWGAATPDSGRRFVSRDEWVRTHLDPGQNPLGRGPTAEVLGRSGVYYGFDAESFRCLVLDTNNPHGGWQGSLSEEQAAWLEEELETAARRPVLLFSHHPLESLTNDYAPEGGHRVLADELRLLVVRHPNVIAWFNGHTHCNAIRAVGEPGAPGSFWQVTTGSHIDWPQQARVVELLLDRANRQLVVATTQLDHAAHAETGADGLADPIGIASWSRELSRNDYQKRAGESWRTNQGAHEDRCTALVLPLEGAAGQQPMILW